MSEKKNNFLPLLLVGGGAGIAALLIAKNSAKPEEDTSLLGGGGFGGSGDFFGNSESVNPTVTPSGGVPMTPNPIILPMLYPDSVDAGIEDIARDDVNLGLTDSSDGGVNPTNYGPADIAQELALYAGVTAGVSAAGYGVKKGATAIKNAITKGGGKVATSAAGKVANTATKAGGKAVGLTAGKVLKTVGKGAGVLGLLGAVDMFFDITGVTDAHFSQNGLTGNLQGVNTNFSVNTGGITTDKQTSNEVGNMGDTWTKTYESQKKGIEGAKGSTQTWQSSSGNQIAVAGISPADAAKYYESKGDTASAKKFSAVASASKSSGGSSKSSGGGSVSSAISSAVSKLFGGK